MKKKISLKKLELKKKKISNLDQIKGGDEPHNTMDVYCANNTLYPACGASGCWGAFSCNTWTACPATTD